jgi:hypothetical protein
MLKKVNRRRAPLDGSWFRTKARLQSIMRAAARYDDELSWPGFVEDTIVPVWVRMERYHAQETRQHPDGMIFGPVIKVGVFDSPEIPMFGHHHAAGLYSDHALDGLEAGVWGDRWIYSVLDGDHESGGEDVSLYLCETCGHGTYRDDLGLRHDRSACLMDAALVCRDCDWRGLVTPLDTVVRLERCRKLADFVGGRESFERRIEFLSAKTRGDGRPTQTRLMLDSHRWSFFWSEKVLVEGDWKPAMVGGLIQHGPTPVLGDDGAFTFSCWDYGLKAERPATADEIRHIEWSIHT